MNQYDDVDITIDLHRDGLNISNETVKNNIHNKYTTTINGERVAKFFFVVGARNDDVTKVKKLADSLTQYAKKKYPDNGHHLPQTQYQTAEEESSAGR